MRYRKRGQDTSLPPAQIAQVEAALDRSPEERLELEKVRDWFALHKPGPEEFDSEEPGGLEDPFGGYSAPCFPSRQVEVLGQLLTQIKARRQSLKLSLTDVSQRSGLTRAAISRLENGHTLNPTLETIFRLARAVDVDLSWNVCLIDPASDGATGRSTESESAAGSDHSGS